MVVDIVDARGCPGFVGEVYVVVVCTYLMASKTLACHGGSLFVLLDTKACRGSVSVQPSVIQTRKG